MNFVIKIHVLPFRVASKMFHQEPTVASINYINCLHYYSVVALSINSRRRILTEKMYRVISMTVRT